MKQLPHIASLLYGTPWAILPQHHAELGHLYRNYLAGTLTQAAATVEPPAAGGGQVRVSSGISYQVASGIGIISLGGIISKRAPEMMCGPALVDLAKFDAVIEDLSADPLIHTLIMDWDSPGGVCIGLMETTALLREIAQEKRLIAYSDVSCCSAAYYLAAACDEIYFAPSAVIGSIGTYCAGLDDSRAWEMDGLELILAKSGELKAMGHPGKAWTEDERTWLQSQADACGREFRDHVLARRGAVPLDAMQGQWFFAKDAAAELHDGLYRDLPALLSDLLI